MRKVESRHPGLSPSQGSCSPAARFDGCSTSVEEERCPPGIGRGSERPGAVADLERGLASGTRTKMFLKSQKTTYPGHIVVRQVLLLGVN